MSNSASCATSSVPRVAPVPCRATDDGAAIGVSGLPSLWSRWLRWREYGEVLAVIGAVTVGGWFVPMTYHTFGFVYLLVVILLSLRVGRWPVLLAAVVSAFAWNCVFIPPQLSFSVIDFDDNLMLGTYFVVALVAGQLTAQIRAQEKLERQREQRATALYALTRALAEARTFADAVTAALRQADQLFDAETALSLVDAEGRLAPFVAGSFHLGASEYAVAEWAWTNRATAGRFSALSPTAEGLHVPLLRSENSFGVFSVRLPQTLTALAPVQRDLVNGFAGQLALLVEREQLRAAAEREKFFAESDRLHRTLLDSVSHELKTPLAVLRSATDKLETPDGRKRTDLVGEIRTATRRLERLVANLLNQTRLESGGLKPELDWCDARDIVAAARRAAGDALAQRPFHLEVPDDMPLFMADAPLLEQSLANLLLNAALYSTAGGPIEVSAGREEQGGRGRIFLRVDDHGPGLPAELRAHPFQKFQRGPAARAGGLGLGLSIVRGFVLAQGGDVIIDDNRWGGARFSVYLPESPQETVPDDES